MNNEIMQVEFGKRMAECRRERQLTQEELANRVGVTPQALSQYERGLRYPDVSILKSLCSVLNTSADYLLGIEEKRITEVGNPKIQNEIWWNLRNALEPLMIVIGKDIIPAFLEGAYVELISELRLRLSKEGVLMPVVRIQDWLELKPKEFMILAYDNVLYQEIVPETQAVLTENLRINHSALIDGIVPEKISYGQILSVCKAFIERGNTLVYLPKILEILEDVYRQGELKKDAEIADYVAKKIEKKENRWVWLHEHVNR